MPPPLKVSPACVERFEGYAVRGGHVGFHVTPRNRSQSGRPGGWSQPGRGGGPSANAEPPAAKMSQRTALATDMAIHATTSASHHSNSNHCGGEGDAASARSTIAQRAWLHRHDVKCEVRQRIAR